MHEEQEAGSPRSSLAVTIPTGALVGLLVPASANAIALHPLSHNGRTYIAGLAFGALSGALYTYVFNSTATKLDAKRAKAASH